MNNSDKKFNDLQKDIKSLLESVNKLNLAFEINKVKNEKLPKRVERLERGQDDIKRQITEISGFFKYIKWVISFVTCVSLYFGYKFRVYK